MWFSIVDIILNLGLIKLGIDKIKWNMKKRNWFVPKTSTSSTQMTTDIF